MKKKEDFFEEKFKKAILSYPSKNEYKFNAAMRNIAKIVGSSISSRKLNLDPKTKEALYDALEICKDYEDSCDAVYHIKKHVFEAKNKLIVTRNCPTWEKFREEMTVHLEGLRERGFVYIAWRAANPFTVYYVGMTGNSGGERILDLSKNNKLSRAVDNNRATQFTIIYPDTSDNIENVEASFIRIIKKLGYRTFNVQKEPFDTLEGDISALEKFFEQMRKTVEQYIE